MLKTIKKIFLFFVILTNGFFLTEAFGQSGRENMAQEIAVFGMGCFWCAESEFRDPATNQPLPGIISVLPGYAGGTKPNPIYESHEGYKEAVKITYDPSQISYDKLLEIFWHNVDPFDSIGQFCDKGFPYTSVIFYNGDEQKSKSLTSKESVQKLLKKGDIVTEIIPYTTFYDAEEYHQNYKAKNPVRYKYYRWNCGRDQRLKELWAAKEKHND
jgi:peptide-methionine (S)-S-oxide reductase